MASEIYIHGIQITPQTLPKVRRDIGMLFQGGGLIRQLSPIENLLCDPLGVRITGQTLFGFPKRDRIIALELLEQLGFKEHIYQKTNIYIKKLVISVVDNNNEGDSTCFN